MFFELRLAEAEPVRGLTFEATVKSSGKKLHLHYATVVTNGDVSRARVVESSGRYEVAIRLNDDGAAKMTSATARHVGRPLAIILDGGVVADLTVRAGPRRRGRGLRQLYPGRGDADRRGPEQMGDATPTIRAAPPTQSCRTMSAGSC